MQVVNFSCFVAWWMAWWMWRTIYLSKLPRFGKKLRVALGWTLGLFFSKDVVQFSTTPALGSEQPQVLEAAANAPRTP